MRFNKVHILFEQSGTFKKVFTERGHNVTEYDIEKTESVDVVVNLFEQITLANLGEKDGVFDNISQDDLVIAFFPCTYFSDQSQLLSRGDNYGQKKWGADKKLWYSMEQMQDRARFYTTLCSLCLIAIKKGFKLIIENPYGKVNFLRQFFPIKPELVIKDRSAYGDLFEKPTQFFFINCTAKFKLFPVADKTKFVKNRVEDNQGFERSRISPIFAENFCNQFIFD